MIVRMMFGLAAAAIFSLPVSAQTASANSPFEREIAASKTSMMGEPQVAFVHAQAAAKAAAMLPAGAGRDLASAKAEWLEGEASTRMRKPREAAAYLSVAAEAAQRLEPDSKLQGDILRSRGRSHAALGSVQAALADYQDAFRIYQHAHQPRSQAMVLQDIGSVYADAHDYAHMLQYYQQSGEVFTADPTLSLTAHNNKGIALKALSRLPEALTEFRATLAAAVELKSAYLQAHVLTDIALTELALHHPEQAQADLNRGLALAQKDAEARTEKPFLLGVRAKIANEAGNSGLAARALDEAFQGLDPAKTTMEFRDLHEIAAKTYAQAGQQALALKHMEAFKRLDDQGRELAASTNTALMSAQFDFANQNLKIVKLKAGQLEAEARLRTLVFGGVILAAASILVITIFGFLAMMRSRDRIRAANAELEVVNTALGKALKAKTEFLATTSHEIRTPLNGILGMTQVILMDQTLSESVRERLGLVQSSGETMKSLVDDLLDVARVQTGAISIEPAAFDLPQALHDAEVFWSGQASAKGLTLTMNVLDAPKRIITDQARLRQVLFNLMSNALKFTETGGVAIRAAVDGETLIITVQDTGVGIPEYDQERIFEAFAQGDGSTSRKYGGTGLGLSICRCVTEALGGTIQVESAIGEGSAFTIRLPLVLAEAVTPGMQGLHELASAAVLIVDANPLSQSMLKAVIAPKCRALISVNSAAAAFETLAVSQFDLVLIDATALADPAVITALHEASSAQIVVTWPAASAEGAPAVGSDGPDLVVFKPATPAEILAALEGLVTATGDRDLARAA